jgi:hypothetical protein
MQIVINIDEKIYKRILPYKDLPIISNLCNDYPEITHAVANGVPLQKGHGAIKDVSQIEIPMCEDRAYEKWVQVAINSAPTIIEADRSEEHG